jgi:hypothetical protein
MTARWTECTSKPGLVIRWSSLWATYCVVNSLRVCVRPPYFEFHFANCIRLVTILGTRQLDCSSCSSHSALLSVDCQAVKTHKSLLQSNTNYISTASPPSPSLLQRQASSNPPKHLEAFFNKKSPRCYQYHLLQPSAASAFFLSAVNSPLPTPELSGTAQPNPT